MQLKRPHGPSFLLEQLERTSSIAAQVSVEHKDDGTSDRVDVFSVERGRKKKPIKVSSIFRKNMNRNHVENTFSCFD